MELPYYSEVYHPDKSSFAINRSNILRRLEVPENEVDPYVDELITELTQKALEICEPAANYVIINNPDFLDGARIQLAGAEFDTHKMVFASLKKSEALALFIGTVGDAVEHLAKDLMQAGNSLEGLIVDLIGSELAEGIAEYIHQQIGADMKNEGLSITNRYSPGYCGWPVSDQQQIFHLLGEHTCNVKLTESSLMMPIKSVSGIVGVGKEAKYKQYACSRCDAGYCLYRDKY